MSFQSNVKVIYFKHSIETPHFYVYVLFLIIIWFCLQEIKKKITNSITLMTPKSYTEKLIIKIFTCVHCDLNSVELYIIWEAYFRHWYARHCRSSLQVSNTHKMYVIYTFIDQVSLVSKIIDFRVRKYNEINVICCFNIAKKPNVTSDSFNLIQMIVLCMYFVYLWGFLCIFETSNQVISKPVI